MIYDDDRLNTFRDVAENGDRATAQAEEWLIWHDALRAIADGEENPGQIAREALTTLAYKFTRRYE